MASARCKESVGEICTGNGGHDMHIFDEHLFHSELRWFEDCSIFGVVLVLSGVVSNIERSQSTIIQKIQVNHVFALSLATHVGGHVSRIG
jgi:hypothetical protein